jgi:hypothetical protein
MISPKSTLPPSSNRCRCRGDRVMLEGTFFIQAQRLLLLILRMHLGNGSYVVPTNRDTVPDDLQTSVFNTRW